ncbi:MAG TPA: universal stress protein [Cyclobacteriaceae bacterium]|nr:universal stress protein [Cyclobacteriaceae bacterium]
MKKIIIPIDFSPYSASAARTGLYLARRTGAELHFFHVVTGPEEWSRLSVKRQQADPRMEASLVDAQLKMEKFVTNPIFRGINIITHIKTGIPYQQIVELSKSEKADLLIMGAHGAGESHTIFIGSTAQRVIRIAPCPVLSVKKNFTPGHFKKILFPSNFEEDVQSSFRTILKLATLLKSSIEMTFINTPLNFIDTETSEMRMKKFPLGKSDVKIKSFVYNDYNKETGIANAAKKADANMIAMVTHNRKGKPGYLLGITETLLFQTETPVLSITINE